MSLARRAVLAASRTKPVFTVVQSRAGSSASHHDDHHHEEADSTVYPAESFMTPFWRNTLIISAITAVAFKYAPEPGEDVYLTRWIAMYKTPRETWLERNAIHTVQTREKAGEALLIQDAKHPIIHRFRYPQAMTLASPFLVGVGKDVDMSEVVPKQDHDNALKAARTS